MIRNISALGGQGAFLQPRFYGDKIVWKCFQRSFNCNFKTRSTKWHTEQPTAEQVQKGIRLYASMRSQNHSRDHSHSHNHEHIDIGEMVGGGLRNPGVRIAWIGLISNALMVIAKGIGGIVFHSQSLTADAVHALSDMVSDVLTLSTVSITRRAPTKYYPNGFGRIEAMGTFGVSVILMYAGISMAGSSLMVLTEQFIGPGVVMNILSFMHLGHAHGGEGLSSIADWNAAWIALISIIVKEALFQATYRVGIRSNSQVLIANAWHHRIDSLTSFVALLAIGGGQIFQAAWLDPLGGLLVSGLVCKAGWGPMKSSLLELAGCSRRAMESAKLQEVREKALSVISDMNKDYKVNDVLLQPYGASYVAMVQISGGCGEDITGTADKLRCELLRMPHIKQVYITVGERPIIEGLR